VSNTSQKCGFVSIIGAPNVGKSTLVNEFCEAKISIVSPKAQTTRSNIRGISIVDNSQVIFIDTPGIFKINKKLDNRLNRSIILTAKNSLEGVDYISFVVDAKRGIREDEEHIIKLLQNLDIKKILIINKVDLVRKESLLELSLKLNELLDFGSSFMISAKTKHGVSDVMKFMCDVIPVHPWMYPEDEISDTPMRLLASEITREKIFYNFDKEIPYDVFVETESYEESESSVKINQAIYVKTESQKKIIIGNKGAAIKKTGEMSRKDLSRIIGKKVHLYLFVKVRENWMDNKDSYTSSGMEFSK